MKAPELFGALIRAIGIWQLASAAPMLAGLVVRREGWTFAIPAAVAYIVVGLILFLGANAFVRAALPRLIERGTPGGCRACPSASASSLLISSTGCDHHTDVMAI